MSMVPYPCRRRGPSRATYAIVGASVGFSLAVAAVHGGALQAGRGGLSEDVALAFKSAWFEPIKASGGELTLRATPKWVRAAPAEQRQATEEAYAEWRRCRASFWYVRLFVQDAGGVSVVTMAGTPRETQIEPEGFFG